MFSLEIFCIMFLMFLDEFPDLLESDNSCDRLFVLGDINFYFDSVSDVSVADLKKTAAQS